MGMKRSVLSRSVADTLWIGQKLGEGTFPGAVLALWGGLGAGKTALTRGIAQGMGIMLPVSSPTFTLVHQMPGPRILYHMDLYRLQDAEEALMAGLAEMWDGDGVTVIEWPARAQEVIPDARLDITLEFGAEGERLVTLESRSSEYDRLVEDIYENSSH